MSQYVHREWDALATPRRLRLRGTPARWRVYEMRKELRIRIRILQDRVAVLEANLNGSVYPGKFEKVWPEGLHPDLAETHLEFLLREV